MSILWSDLLFSLDLELQFMMGRRFLMSNATVIEG